MLGATITNGSWLNVKYLKDEEKDTDLRRVLKWKRTDRRPTWNELLDCPPTRKIHWAQRDSLTVVDGLLKHDVDTADGTKKK